MGFEHVPQQHTGTPGAVWGGQVPACGEGGVLRTTSGGERGFSALWPCERSKPGRASGVLVGVPGVLAVLRVQSLGGDAYRMCRSGPSTQ